MSPRRFTIAGLALGLFVALFYLSCAERASRAPSAAEPTPPKNSPAQTSPRPAVTAAPVEMPPMPAHRPVYAIWVARSQYQTPEDVRAIIENCANYGFNTVLWQVRGEATVSYPSALEPWGREFGYRNPGFDPLGLALAEAKKRNLRLEAWVNVLPGWRGKTPPPIAEQLYSAHPDWFLYDAKGHRQPLGDFYSIVNPCLPEVREHITDVIDEIAARYEIDGIHLDYVRYAWDTTRNAAKLYPRDSRTLAIYRAATGMTPDQNAGAWNDWRAAQLTQLVTQIRAALRQRRPEATLTAAVKPDPSDALRGYFQNSADWLTRQLLDAAMPMAYTTDVALFERNINAYRRVAVRKPIVPGIGAYKMTDESIFRAELERCRAWGGHVSIFSYDSLFPSADDRNPPPEPRPTEAQRSMRRRVWAEYAGISR